MANEILISNYKSFYKKLTPHQGKRQEVLFKLNEFLNRYYPIIKDINDDCFYNETDLNKLIFEIENFLKITFNKEVNKLFSDPPSIDQSKIKKANIKRKTGLDFLDGFAELLIDISSIQRTQNVSTELLISRNLKSRQF